YNLFSDEEKVNDYDAFMTDFRDSIQNIHNEYSKNGYNILLNVSSGTPAMKSNLLLEVVNSNIKLIPIQVSTPANGSNYHKEKIIFNIDLLSKIDEQKEQLNNRCSEIKVLSFKKVKIKSQIESLINRYEYSAALQIFNEDENAVNLFDSKLPVYLKHCVYRMNSQFREAEKLLLDNSINVLDYSNGNEIVREFFEYYYIMKIRQSKGALTDFILRITPFITKLLYYFLDDKYNLNIDKYIDTAPNGTSYIKRELIDKNNKDLLRSLDKKFKFKDTFLNFNTLINIAYYYRDKFNDNNYVRVYDAFKYFSRIEKERNKAAHTMINIDEDFIKSNLNKSSIDILKNCESLLKMIFNYQNDYFVYDDINKRMREV
ncbi:type III-A CRISPR-associated CARF protein Csm6, partial [Brachyspira catarrhinii]